MRGAIVGRYVGVVVSATYDDRLSYVVVLVTVEPLGPSLRTVVVDVEAMLLLLDQWLMICCSIQCLSVPLSQTNRPDRHVLQFNSVATRKSHISHDDIFGVRL